MTFDPVRNRNRKLKIASFASVVLLLVVLAASFAEAGLSVTAAANLPKLPRPFLGAQYSLNWAGYAVASSFSSPQPTVTMVNGSWTVQTVVRSRKPTYSAQWVGIGGYFDSSLIQTGTSSDAAGGTTSYYAWYELLPASETQLGSSYPVSAGDTINGFVFLVSTNNWNITLNDLTKGWHFSIIVNYASSQTSAEWIEERPSIAGSITSLANFGTSYYGDDYVPSVPNTNYATVGGNTQPIGSLTYQSITMVANNGKLLAVPSTLSADGTSFTVKYSGR